MEIQSAERPAGTIRPVTRYGSGVLHRPCAHVTSFGPSLEALVSDMFASMYAARGVGLAANQIGVSLRVFVYDCLDGDGRRRVGHVVNPVLTTSTALAPPSADVEGCLSVPDQHAVVLRPVVATIRGWDMRGDPVAFTGRGPLARCLQHETDHLEGIVYVDLLPPDKRAGILIAAGLPGRRRRTAR